MTEAIRNRATHPRRWYNDLTTKEEDNMNINTTVIDSMDIDTLKATLIGVLKGNHAAALLGVLNGKAKDETPAVSKKLYPTRGERVNAAGAACMPILRKMAKGGVNCREVFNAGGGAFNHDDVYLAAKKLLEDGVITESRQGRKTWHLV